MTIMEDCDNKDCNLIAEEFIQNLLNKGSEVSCDETNEKYIEYKLPKDFDETKFKRGQEFFNANIFPLFIGKLLGLTTILAVPSILKVLIFTKMSSTPFTAYKRYMSTIFHMVIWYKKDFHPESQLWKSIEDVRRRHNLASKRSTCIGASRITQLDMALTQFGFMGYALHNPKGIGLFTKDDEGLRAWIYLWQVIGNLMGIEDRFNICRDSIEETRAICNALVAKQFRPYIEKWDSSFLEMARAIFDGMWCMQPFLNPELVKIKITQILFSDSEMYKKEFETLTPRLKVLCNFHNLIVNSCKNSFWKWYHNMTIHVSLWLMHYFPFLAIYRYGRKDSYVRILESQQVREVYQSS